MERPFIEVVTVTGADDSVKPEDLFAVARDYPFVEFGILLSKKQQGTRRFPSKDWLAELYIEQRHHQLNLSGHLCGSWVRNLCVGMPTFFEDFGYTWKMFHRFQLNFHAEPHAFNERKFAEVLKRFFGPIIFQMDGANENIFSLMKMWPLRINPLFDLSGGAGVSPKDWPRQLPNMYCGYAGGLSPDNLQQEIERISKVAQGPIWIDAETQLRSKDDTVFDIDKVCFFLEKAKPWVTG